MNCTICGLPTGNIVGSVLPQCKCNWQAPQPPQTPRQWQGLTEKRIEELYSFWIVDCQDIVGFARAIERTFKEKNDGQ